MIENGNCKSSECLQFTWTLNCDLSTISEMLKISLADINHAPFPSSVRCSGMTLAQIISNQADLRRSNENLTKEVDGDQLTLFLNIMAQRLVRIVDIIVVILIWRYYPALPENLQGDLFFHPVCSGKYSASR